MIITSKNKSCSKPVVDFESNSERIKSYKCFQPKIIKADNLVKRPHANNQQVCIDCLKPRSNKNERE